MIPISSVMNKDVLIFGRDTAALAMLDAMHAKHMGAAVILDGALPIGIFTERDVIRCITEHRDAFLSKRAEELMTAPVITISPDENIETASVIMLDIDHFKIVNDTYGHQCGDMVLRRVAAIMLERSMGINTVGRYGGEEFIIVGPISDHTSAFQAAEAIRLSVGAERFSWEGKGFAVTISAGVAIWQRDMNVYKELVAAADEALYEAKRAGRDRVVLAPTSNSRRK